MKIVTVSQMQQAERGSSQFGISLDQLMQSAGKAVAEEVRRIIGDIHRKNILILVGPGNNGGDGLVAARYLYDWGTGRVKVYLCAGRPENDPNLEEVKKRGIHCREASNDLDFSKFNDWLAEADAVLDSMFGTGKRRPLTGHFAQILTGLNEAKRERPDLRVIALDLPSGLDADTGLVDPATPQADNTITLGFPKAGLFNLPGAEKAGKIAIVDIGIPHQLVDYINLELLDDKAVSRILPRRPPVSHKGTYGKIMALAGSINYTGAAYLACSGSVRVGAGLTTLAIARSLYPILAAKLSEVTYLPLTESGTGIASEEALMQLREQLPRYDVLLIGCGLGQDGPIKELVATLLTEPQIKIPPVVLDADGINILAGLPDWWKSFEDDAILTPHAGEMSRLTGRPIAEIQGDRAGTTQEAAAGWHKTLVLKGAYTIIASPDGRVRISPFANAGLASAGTGDVLAGAIAGMVSQGLSLFDAASCGVYLHGLAGEMVKNALGDAGMLASDLLPALPRAIRQLKEI
jgi:hydroxyethylthiazole kinase-like uncharacterized protein yjeF